MSKVTTNVNHPLKKSSQLRKIAEMVSKFYGLNILINEAEFNSYSGRVDMKILTPSDKVIVVFHMSFFSPWNHWTFAGQSCTLSQDYLEELRRKAWELIGKTK